MNAVIKVSVLVVVAAAVMGSGVAEASCRVEGVKVVRERVGAGCWLAGVSGRIVDPTRRALVDVSGDVLSCGAVEINQWREVRREGLAICESLEEGESPMDLSSGIEVLSLSRGRVSVDFVESGYTGGAHPFAVIERRTLDRRTGRAMEVGDVLPGSGALVLARARVKFGADEGRSELYVFDPRSFAVFEGPDGVRVAFSFTHGIEVVRGTTLDVEVAVPGGGGSVLKGPTAVGAL